MLFYLKLLLLATITLLLVLFCVVNREAVELSLFPLPYTIALPTYLFTLLFLVIGYSIAALIGSSKRLSQTFRLKRQSKRLDALENEVQGLKHESSLPKKS